MSIHAYAAGGDLAGLLAEIDNQVSLESHDAQGQTPLMVAVASPLADAQTLRLLLDSGANVNAVSSPPNDPEGELVLSIAAQNASLDKIKLLVEAGADVGYADTNGYSILLRAVYRSSVQPVQEHLAVLDFLIASGAPLDMASKYGETAARVLSSRGHFPQLQLLLKCGADSTSLGWTPLHFASALGTLQEVETLLDQGASLTQRDSWGRTPFLLAVHAVRLEVAKLLLARGSDRSAKGRCGKTALMYAIERSHAPLLGLLLTQGWDAEEPDDFGDFPLLEAVQNDSADCVRVLLQAGANASRETEHGGKAMKSASTPEIVHLLVAAGEDLSDTNSEARCRLTGIPLNQDLKVAESDYRQNKHRRFGASNPEHMNNPFWEAMVRSRTSAYAAAAKFDDTHSIRNAVWCFQRFGHSLTQLPDGRYVEIAGEHEDSYDQDFCIYNDVVVHQGNGQFEILGYSKDDFPPTDFHSATFVAPYIYIIGNLGYHENRLPGVTPIYRLHCGTWKIERVPSSGNNPGWIHRHKARLMNDRQIEISGGKIVIAEKSDLIDNENIFILDLDNFIWRMAPDRKIV